MNRVSLATPAASGESAVLDQFPDLLRDESRLVAGVVTRVYRPSTPEAVAAVVGEAGTAGVPLCVSGARTGISGGAVPQDTPWVLSLEGLDRIVDAGVDPMSGERWVRVEAGVTLTALARWLKTEAPAGLRGFLYPVDPTEWSASVGGTVATNASGGRSYRYGPTARWVRALRVVLADGRMCWVRRGEVVARDGQMVWPAGWGDRRLRLPELPEPRTRCVAGYAIRPDGDLVDLLVGSEGTLAVVVEAELALAPEPEGLLGLFVFLPSGVDGLDAVVALRNEPDLAILTAEFLDAASLDLVREFQAQGVGGDVPVFPDHAASALFLELEIGRGDDAMMAAMETLDRVLTGLGASLDDTWAGEGEADRQRMRHLRHAVPEAVNTWIRTRARSVPGLHKVGTDLAVPDEGWMALRAAYEDARTRAGMRSVLFGHAAENHLHLNFLPDDLEALERAQRLHEALAREAVRLGGAVTAEHGIGRLKRSLVAIQFGADGVAALRSVKDFMDPHGILNPGVLLP
jgi:D-lactate dehydrogenase (cytochrome)